MEKQSKTKFSNPNSLAHKSKDKPTIHDGTYFIPFGYPEGEPSFEYTPNFLTGETCEQLMEKLDQVDFQQAWYTKYNMRMAPPRLTFTFGTPDLNDMPMLVTWKGRKYMTEPIPEWLSDLKKSVEKYAGCTTNACILNKYRDSQDHISWHHDDEKFLRHETILSISLGATREFYARAGKEEKEHHLNLLSGSLTVLKKGIKHCLPARKGRNLVNAVRYNITFRALKVAPALNQKASGFGNYYMYNRGEKYEIKE
jgi:alkylated DNA repair dioxygenase AlkB